MSLGKLKLVVALFSIMLLTSCTHRLVDFTVISSKNVELGVKKSQGKSVEGKKTYFLGMGWNIKDAMDIALESAGKDYDLLVDGVVTYQNLPFVLIVKVKGVAISTEQMRADLGAEGFDAWAKCHNIFNPETAIATEENN